MDELWGYSLGETAEYYFRRANSISMISQWELVTVTGVDRSANWYILVRAHSNGQLVRVRDPRKLRKFTTDRLEKWLDS